MQANTQRSWYKDHNRGDPPVSIKVRLSDEGGRVSNEERLIDVDNLIVPMIQHSSLVYIEEY